MSAIPIQSGDNPYFADDFDADEPNAHVYVNGTEIPTVNKSLYIRNEGPLDLSRYLETTFASPVDGEHYTRLFGSLAPEQQTTPDIVRVDIRDYATDTYVPAFQGIVTGVGHNEDTHPRLWKLRSQGPSHLLSNIPVSKRFTDASAADIISFIAEKLKGELPFPVQEVESPSDTGEVTDDDSGLTVTIPLGFDETAGTSENNGGFSATIPLGFGGSLSGVMNPEKTFTYGKDTLADVFAWLGRKTNLYFWFQPTPNGVTLVTTRQPATQHHDAHYLDGNLHIEENNALAELKPINTLTVKAPAKESSSGNTEKIAVATARHQGLYQRAGNTELHADTHRLTNSQTKANVEHEARKELKTAITEATAGSMTALAAPYVTPFDTVTALPTAHERVAENLDPLTFEVARVEHDIGSGPHPRTKLNVGVHTDPSEDIEIIDSWITERGS